MNPVQHILVVNAYSSENAGDAALTEEMLHQLRENFPGSRITLAMDDPASHSGNDRSIGSILYWCKRTAADGQSVWNWAGLLRVVPVSLLSVWVYRLFGRQIFPLLSAEQRESVQAYFSADIVLSKPGGYIYSSSGLGLPFLLIIYQIALAILAGKPHYLLPQSIGPITRNWQKRLVRWAVNHSRLSMMREPISMNELAQLHANPSQYTQVFDMAFAFEPSPPHEARQWLHSHGVDKVDGLALLGVTALNWQAQNGQFRAQAHYEEALAAALEAFIQAHPVAVVFLPQVVGPTIEQDDTLVAARIAQRINHPDRVKVIRQQPHAALLKAAMGQMNLMLGTRMHSNIFALSAGVPTLAIGYLHKTRGIMQMLGLEPWVLDIESITAQSLTEKLEQLWAEQISLSALIRERMIAAKQSAAGATAQVRLNFDGRAPVRETTGG